MKRSILLAALILGSLAPVTLLLAFAPPRGVARTRKSAGFQ